jgi:hypothetical protein
LASINSLRSNNIFCLSVSFSEFNDIENDFEIYEFAWEKFNLFIENIDFKEIYKQQKEKNYIRKLQFDKSASKTQYKPKPRYAKKGDNLVYVKRSVVVKLTRKRAITNKERF